ncbi:Peptidase family M48 [Amycolatopsis marina]|uniref:Peptidase family M48 n=1 Tax=Amycolatopsis marina TaxID=490629 RepID=A0A1I1C3I8_9PSEU|nr:M56 family metallopeptidase [Amycolatopsis marina]SFB56682.1 Peptidase family M48 [Amycolatopsis marina]
MTVALALLLGAITAGWLVPRRLQRIDLRRRDPRTLTVTWLASMIGVGAAGVSGVVLLLTPEHGAEGPLTWALNQCVTALQHGSPPQFEELIGLASFALLGALVLRFVVVGARELRRLRRESRQRLAVLRLAGRPDNDSPGTLWLAHDRPLAFSLLGRPSVIIATEGLTRHLPEAGVAAVLAHERAHLRGRHHLLIAFTEVVRRTIPFVPLFRQAPVAMRELVELAADMSAVRTCGPAAVRTALLTVSGHDAPGVALAMGRDTVSLRLERLEHTTLTAGRTRSALSCGAAGALATAVPFLTSASLLVTIAVLACPVTGT